MAIVETKADQLMDIVDKRKSVSVKDAALALSVSEEYVRRIALALEKNGLIGLKASAFTLTLLSKQE